VARGKWLPTRLLAWPMGSLPQHAVPRKASGRVVVLGRAANNARRARSLHLEAVLNDAGCQPKATIAHLYVQPSDRAVSALGGVRIVHEPAMWDNDGLGSLPYQTP
jgi:hypothetical protein